MISIKLFLKYYDRFDQWVKILIIKDKDYYVIKRFNFINILLIPEKN